MKIKTCNFCHGRINLDIDKYVLIGTYEKKKALDEGFYHWKCFNEWYNKQVMEKVQNTILDAQQKAMGFLKNMGGVQNVQV